MTQLPFKLNAGCGQRPTPGFINVDIELTSKADVICSLEALPFKSGVFSEIVCNHVLEHLTEDMWRNRTQLSSAVLEFSRVLLDNGVVKVEVPSPQGESAVRSDHCTVYSWRTLKWIFGLYFQDVRCSGVGTWVQMKGFWRFFDKLGKVDPFWGDGYAFRLSGPRREVTGVIKY